MAAAPSPDELRREHSSVPVPFLDHGSFAACLRPVFVRYEALQGEREPIDFLDRRSPAFLNAARAHLAGRAPAPGRLLAALVRELHAEDGQKNE